MGRVPVPSQTGTEPHLGFTKWVTAHPSAWEACVELMSPCLAGPCPVETSGTRSHFALTDFPEEGTWSAVLQQQDGAALCVSLCSPASACVGRYSLTLEASTDYQGSTFHIGDFILLFNAWHPGEAFAFPTLGLPELSFPALWAPAAGCEPLPLPQDTQLL